MTENEFYDFILDRVNLYLFNGIYVPSNVVPYTFVSENNAFVYGGRIYFCRNYQKYFRYLIEELLDLSRNSVLGCDEKRTYVFRKRMGVLDDGDIVSYEDIAKDLNTRKETVKKYYCQACNFIVRYFIDYSHYHFLQDVRSGAIDKQSIFLRELFPYECYRLDWFEKNESGSRTFKTVGDLCRLKSSDLKYSSTLILHRLHCLGLGLQDETLEDIGEVSEKDILLEMPISFLNFSNKVARYMDRCRIYNILGICINITRIFYAKGLGNISVKEVKDKLHALGFGLINENDEDIATMDSREFRSSTENNLYNKLEQLLKDRDSLVTRENLIESLISEFGASSEEKCKNLQNEKERLKITRTAVEVQINKILVELGDRQERVSNIKSRVRLKEDKKEML